MGLFGLLVLNAVVLIFVPIFFTFVYWQSKTMVLPLIPQIIHKLEQTDEPHYGRFVTYDRSFVVAPFAGFSDGWRVGARVRLNQLEFENWGAYVEIELRDTAEGWLFERDFKVEHYPLIHRS